MTAGPGPIQIISQVGPTGPTGQQGDPGPQSRTAGPTGATGPTGAFQTAYPGTISADTFEGNYFTSSHVLTANIGNFQTIYLNGENVYSNVLSILQNQSVTSSLLGGSADGGSKYFHLGTFTAPTGGVVLKLNLVACSGFNINNEVLPTGVMSQPVSQIYDLCVYFFTSNGDKVNLGPTVLRGFGWCTQTHTVQRPMTVYVTTTGTASTGGGNADYDFYVLADPYIGAPVITATTSGRWRTDPIGATTGTGGALSTRPANSIKLPTASVNTSMTTVLQSIAGGI